MSKAKFAAVKELIGEKKYDEARKLLKTIDHPTAREWEEKLNKVTPEDNPKRRYAGNLIKWGIVALFFCIIGLIALLPPQPKSETLWTWENIAKRYGGDTAYIEESDSRIRMVFRLNQWDVETAISDAKYKMVDLLCGVQEHQRASKSLKLDGAADLVDAFGNTEYTVVLSGTFNPDVIEKINCDNPYNVDVFLIAEDLYVHPALG